jgi:hypothetical protein
MAHELQENAAKPQLDYRLQRKNASEGVVKPLLIWRKEMDYQQYTNGPSDCLPRPTRNAVEYRPVDPQSVTAEGADVPYDLAKAVTDR